MMKKGWITRAKPIDELLKINILTYGEVLYQHFNVFFLQCATTNLTHQNNKCFALNAIFIFSTLGLCNFESLDEPLTH